jgi:hypothetical protein
VSSNPTSRPPKSSRSKLQFPLVLNLRTPLLRKLNRLIALGFLIKQTMNMLHSISYGWAASSSGKIFRKPAMWSLNIAAASSRSTKIYKTAKGYRPEPSCRLYSIPLALFGATFLPTTSSIQARVTSIPALTPEEVHMLPLLTDLPQKPIVLWFTNVTAAQASEPELNQ